jgi:hypothetical protein
MKTTILFCMALASVSFAAQDPTSAAGKEGTEVFQYVSCSQSLARKTFPQV